MNELRTPVDVLAVLAVLSEGSKLNDFDFEAGQLDEVREAIAELIEQYRRLLQAYAITSDDFEEVEVDDEMVSPYGVLCAARNALARCGVKP